MNQLVRVALLAYPRQFRRDYGTEWSRTLRDLQTHSGHSTPRIAATVVGEVFTTAIRMRWENLMTPARTALMVIVGVVALVALMMGSEAIALLVVALVALIVLQFAGRDRPIALTNPSTTRRWYLCLAGAAAAFLSGFAALAIDGDDNLSEPAWAIWIFSWTAAALLGVIGLTLGATRLITNLTTPTRSTP